MFKLEIDMTAHTLYVLQFDTVYILNKKDITSGICSTLCMEYALMDVVQQGTFPGILYVLEINLGWYIMAPFPSTLLIFQVQTAG